MSEGRNLSALAVADLVPIALGPDPEAAEAWRLLVERHAGLVWKVVRCFRLSKEASWEAYQSTWLRAVERLGTLHDPASFPWWLVTIARREALGVIRARTRDMSSVSFPDEVADHEPVGDRLQRDELRRAVREGLALLPQYCQDLLRLLSADPPIPYREIERLLDMPHGAIGPTRRRCLDKLRKTRPIFEFFGHQQ